MASIYQQLFVELISTTYFTMYHYMTVQRYKRFDEEKKRFISILAAIAE